MANLDPEKYAHSPVHKAVISRDYPALKRALSGLPRLSGPSEVQTEAQSIAEESKADAISSLIDRRDVPNRETPLHLAVKLADAVAVELLVQAGADSTLQNEQGWSALQEAICAREETLARIIVRHSEPLTWAKWCRRLPRLLATMRRMRDFYMEITFHFESSVIPFVSRIAPSDTYKIWKRGSNLRADMTLAGFDWLKIQRADQSVLFLGDGSEDGKARAGSLCVVSHKDKEVMNAFEGAGTMASDSKVQNRVKMMSRTSVYRPGVDVTQAVLLPQLNWRRNERAEMVGNWKASVYDMHNVVVSFTTRRVPGAMTDEEFILACDREDSEREGFENLITEDEKRQLENALKMESPDAGDEVISHRHSCFEQREIAVEDMGGCSNSDSRQDKKSWFGNWGRRSNVGHKQDGLKKSAVPPRSSVCVDDKVSDILGESPSGHNSRPGDHDGKRGRDRDLKKSASTSENVQRRKEASKENVYKHGLQPVLWLSRDFPLRTEELLPLLDILANKVKAVRRLRELLTTKLPPGTFPVKVAIPVVPTIRVIVTFTKFQELQPSEEFSTPPSSTGSRTPEAQPSSSWIQWIKAPYRQSMATGPSSRVEDIQDPFAIPSDYTWTTPDTKEEQESKNKSNKGF